MVAAALKFIMWIVGIFFPAKDERHQERDAGEALGKAETTAADSMGELHDISKADAARSSVSDDAGSVCNDPANAGPAQPGQPR